MAPRAIVAEIVRHVVGVRRAVEFRRMARVAIRVDQLIVAVRMA